MQRREALAHQSAEEAREHTHGQEEFGLVVDLSRFIRREAAARNKAVDVGAHRRASGAQHEGCAKPGTKMVRASADDHQRLGCCREQGVVDGSLVGERGVGERCRHGEHGVVTGHAKTIPLARFEPVMGGRGLPLRTMPAAARVTSDVEVGAVLASADMAAENSGAACPDR